MEFQPFYDRVLVRPEIEETEKETEYGVVVIQSTSKEDVKVGTVVASGEGRLSPEGKLVENSAKEGDRVLFHINDAIVYNADEKDKMLAILRDTDIIAVITE